MNAVAASDGYDVVDLPRVEGRHRNRALAHARANRALAMRAQGMTYQEIADELGYSNRGAVHHVIHRALQRQATEAAEELRYLENTRLDALQQSLWGAAMDGDVEAATAIVRIIAARVRLNGLAGADINGRSAAPVTVVQRRSN
ncbi:hypothetical protein [Ornithinimicrobium sediminis]|uniref:hypothetical protein n=1 Tax=Ornithinimicrobium sediminis TaxID=2904603 RepID=UPI001E58290B|nr:hypothetical protein [Ornithinimicrobium sediminis]MCE0488146.1 hypothetical protein [Ornithinimicrobium sediminis]